MLFNSLTSVVLVLSVFRSDAAYPIVPPIPVDSDTPGIRYMPHDPRPRVTVEIFIDLNCPDSRDGWPILKNVQDHYGNDKLDVIVQQMPLPYHRNAFLCTQGMYLIENSTDNNVRSHLFDYMETSMFLWSNFSTANTVSKTELEVLDMLADMAVEQTGISKDEFITHIYDYKPVTRNAWKFASKRGVSNTPAFFCNGVELGNGLAIPTYNDWITFLDTIIQDNTGSGPTTVFDRERSTVRDWEPSTARDWEPSTVRDWEPSTARDW